MSRSSKKGVFVDEKLLMKVQKAVQTKDRKPIKTWSRRSTITADFVGVTLSIHNGKDFLGLHVSEEMVGHRVGEFAPTRRFRGHGISGEKAAAGAAKAKT